MIALSRKGYPFHSILVAFMYAIQVAFLYAHMYLLSISDWIIDTGAT